MIELDEYKLKIKELENDKNNLRGLLWQWCKKFKNKRIRRVN